MSASSDTRTEGGWRGHPLFRQQASTPVGRGLASVGAAYGGPVARPEVPRAEDEGGTASRDRA